MLIQAAVDDAAISSAWLEDARTWLESDKPLFSVEEAQLLMQFLDNAAFKGWEAKQLAAGVQQTLEIFAPPELVAQMAQLNGQR